MPIFYYTGKNSNKELTSETIVAASLDEARRILDSQNVVYYNLIEEQRIPFLKWQTISRKNILFFTRYFAVLIKAGITVFKSLNILEKQEKNPNFKEKIRIIREEIESGKNLYQAFKRFDSLFGTFYCNLIRIGEETGKLSDVLERLADYIENSRNLRKKIISVLLYPSLVFFMIFLITMLLLTIIVPKFTELYWQLGLSYSDLPWITKRMIDLGDFLRKNLLWEISVIILTIAGIYEIYHTRVGRAAIDDLILRTPLLGNITIQYNMSVFCIHLSILFESGYTVLRSFDMAVDIVKNYSLRMQMTNIINSLEAGRGIAQSFREVDVIPDLAIEMIEIGEETASFDKMLRYIAEFYEKEIDLLTKTFVSLIEPLLMIVLGLIVLVVLLSIYLPIFKLAASIKVF